MKSVQFYSLGFISLAAAAQPVSCSQDANTVLTKAKSDIATAEHALATGVSAFCAQLPQLQATADTILSVTTIDARTAGEVAAGKAAAAVACSNPTQTNIAAVAVKVATAKAAVSAALKAGQ